MPLSPHAESPGWLRTRVSSWFWSLTPACQEVARLTSEQREHPLPLALRARLGLHRTFCQWCARYAKQLDFMEEASQLFPEHLDDLHGPDLDPEQKARMKRALRDSHG